MQLHGFIVIKMNKVLHYFQAYASTVQFCVYMSRSFWKWINVRNF